MKFFKIVEAYTLTPPPATVYEDANLATGEGHGHFRPLRRHKAAANITKKQKKARKMTKRSRRENRRSN